jgi:adenosylhomocysteinase
MKPHNCPIVSIAQSPLKYVEDTTIGDAVVFSIERILREEFSAFLQGARCAVIGFGKIGRSTAVALKGRETVVSIYDINPSKDITAQVEGFYPLPLHDLLAVSEVVIGCTGQTSIRAEDMPFIRDGTILASASSKDVEFALSDFEKACKKTERVNDTFWKYTQQDDRVFYILYRGSPVNFRDRSIIGTTLDLIYSELFIGIREIAARRAQKDLHHSSEEFQNEVAKAWLRTHTPAFDTAGSDKIWTYPESLDLGRA